MSRRRRSARDPCGHSYRYRAIAWARAVEFPIGDRNFEFPTRKVRPTCRRTSARPRPNWRFGPSKGAAAVIAEIGVPRSYWLGSRCRVGRDRRDLGPGPSLARSGGDVPVRRHALRRRPAHLLGPSGVRRAERTSRHRRPAPCRPSGCLIVLGALTVGLGFLADADGADHSSTIASDRGSRDPGIRPRCRGASPRRADSTHDRGPQFDELIHPAPGCRSWRCWHPPTGSTSRSCAIGSGCRTGS